MVPFWPLAKAPYNFPTTISKMEYSCKISINYSMKICHGGYCLEIVAVNPALDSRLLRVLEHFADTTRQAYVAPEYNVNFVIYFILETYKN